MTPLAAAAVDLNLGLWAVVACLLWVLIYVVSCAVFPFAACRRCKGAGRFRSPGGKAWRPCGKCGGSSSRVRAGRKLWTAASGTYRKGNR